MTDRNLLVSLPRVRWTAHAEPIHLPLAQVMYQLRRHDADEGLLLDALNLADIEASVEHWLALDALTSPYAQLERKMQILQRTLSRVSPTLKPVALQLSAPFRQHGSTQVTVIFELSDGQTLTIYFHNPDTTPHKINPNDELVSWKWLLNKKDITIVVAPEQGKDLNLLEVATRVIKLAEKNSPAFIRANVKRAEEAKEITQLNTEIAALEKELTGLQSELELIEYQRNEAQQQAEKRKQAQENNPPAEFTSPEKPYVDYLHEANGDALLASKSYFNNELIGKYVDTVIGKVWLLGSSRGKMIYGRGKRSIEIKSKIIPFVPEILKQGKYEGRDELYKQRNDAYVAFHAFTKDITTNGYILNVRIYVGERENDRYEFVAYDMKANKEQGNSTIQQNLDSVKWNPLRSGNVQTVTPDAMQRPQERTTSIPSVSPCVIRQEPPEHLQKITSSSGGGKPPLDAISYRTTNIVSRTGKIPPHILDKVNPEIETGWNIRILKVIDLATNQRLYALEDAVDDADIVQQTVSNQAETTPSNPVIAHNKPATATLYAFNEKRTQAQRKRDNAAALALLKAIDSSEKDAQNLSIADKTLLARYSGTGGALIGADGKKGSAYEYYTPAPIASGMWNLLKELGFLGGKVLDPCAGTGIFSAMAPDNAVIDAVELNEISGKVNQLVNNQTGRNTTIAPFEQVANQTPDEIYEAVISNVPFGGVADRGGNQLLDNKYQKEPLQNYFILRSLEKLKPGGLALFIVPPRCISGKGGKEESLRVKISYLAEFLGAYRLPNKVFGSASADTMTDIIALRKYSHNVLEKIDELRQQAPEILIQANVQWPVFTQGHYFEDEGKHFVLGEFVPKDPAKFRDIDRVKTDKPVAEIAQMLAKFPDSRINWDLLEASETLPILYREGDSVYQSGQILVLNNGQWIAQENQDKERQAKQFSAILSDPYKTFTAQLSYEQVHTWFDYMIQAGPLNVSDWLRPLMNELQKLENPAQCERYWQAGIIALAVQQVLNERLSDDEPVDFLGEYVDLSAALKKHAHTYNKCPPALRGVLNDAFAVARIHYRKKSGYSAIWCGEGKEKLNAQAVDAQSGFDGLRYQAQSIWVNRQQAAQVLGNEFDPMNSDEWCISADGKTVARADDVYVGNVADYLVEIDQQIATCHDESIKAKLLRQKLHAQTRIHPVKADSLHFSLQSPHVSLEDKCEFLRRFVHPSAVIVIDNESGKPAIDFAIKGSKLSDQEKLTRRLGHWIKKGSITLGGIKLNQDERDGLNQLQGMCNRANEQFNTWVKGNQRITDTIQSTLNNPDKQRFTQIDDESALSIAGMNPALQLHGYQNAFVRRMGRDFSGINGFGVGLGKTFTALASVQYAQSIGVKSKTLFVVPGSVLSNWQKEVSRAYTHTDDCLFIGLTLDKKGKGVVKSSQYDADLNKILENRHRKIFMTMEAFERIRLREDTIKSYEKYLRTHDSSFAESNDKKKDEQKKSAVKTLLELLTDKKGSAPYLEDMGIDSLVMDEAHAYKNSASTLDVDKARYLSLAPASQRGIDAQAKAWVVRGKSGKRNDGVLLLTATPITNSPLEIYSMLSLAGGIERLNNQFAGIKGADDFMKTVCVIENGPDVSSDGIKRITNIFTGLSNVPLLRHALNATTVIKEAHEVGAQVILPEGEDKPTAIVLPDNAIKRLKQYKGAFRYAVDHLSNKRPNRGDKNAFDQLQQETGESIELIGHPFNLINKMSQYIADPELETRASFWQYDQAQRQQAQTVIEQFNALKRIEEHSRKGRYTQDKAIAGKVTIKDGLYLKEKLKIQVLAQLLESENKIVLDSIDPANQSSFEKLADKAGLNLDVSISPKLAALLDNIQLEQATPRGATAEGEKLPYTKQIIFCDILPLHYKIKHLLVQRAGIEAKHIAMITGQINNSPDEILAVAEGFNAHGEDNKYRFIIANQKAEVGINLQQGTQAIHHLTIGWTPDSLTQRNGRAVRQGNRTARVSVYYYDAEGTFDVSKRSMVNKKADWIGQLISGKEENNLAVSGGLTRQQQEALIETVGDSAAIAQIENSIAVQEKRERIERNRTAQLTQLDTIAKQRKFLDDYKEVNHFIHQRALQAWDIWQEVNRLQNRLETFKGKESLAIRLNNALEQEREKLNHLVHEVDSSLIIHEIKERYPEIIKGKSLNVLEAMQKAANGYGRGDKKSDFLTIINGNGYHHLSEAVSGSILENEWQSEIDMARNLLESAQKEFIRQAQFEGAFPENLAEKIASGQGIIYNNQPIVAGTFARQDDILVVFDGSFSDYASRVGQPHYYARHPDTPSASINLNQLILIYPGQSDWDECVNQAVELEDKINLSHIQRGGEADFDEFSRIVPEVAQRSTLAKTASYSIQQHTLPAPYFPYVITEIMAKESRLLEEIYDAQASIVIGRDWSHFTVPVDTDIGISQDENARFDALIQYALAQGKKLDRTTLKVFDRRGYTDELALKHALHIFLSQSLYQEEFTKHISKFKEQNKTIEELSKTAQQWLIEKTKAWLDGSSLNSNEVLLDWMKKVIEDKPLLAPNHYTDDDLVWVSGKNDPEATKQWKSLIKRYANLHSSIAKWNGRKLAWGIRFKAWKNLITTYPNAANELHLI